MEAGGVGTRQSGPTTANNQKPEQQYFEPRRPEFRDRSFSREAPQMATATLINPTPSGPYHSHNSSYSPPYPHHSSAPSIASMVSPVESRRTSDDQTDTGSIRQSLPSISDVLSSTPKLALFPPAPPSSVPGSTTLPSPFSTSTRTFPDGPSSEKDASPRTLHPQPGTFPPRPDSLPAPSDSSRASYSRPAPPPPLNTFVASQPSPPIRPEHSSQESEQRHSEHSAPPHPNGSFPGPPPPHPISYPPAPGPLPPSQLPLPPAPPFPLSPRHPGPPQHSYDTSRPYMYPTDEYTERQRYEMAMRQQLTHFMDLFDKMGGASRTIYGFSDHWSPVVRENHTIPPMASRLPSLREISDMIANADMIKGSLEALRELVQQSLAESERRAAGAAAMEAGVPSGMPGGALGKGKGPDEPEAKSYYIPEVKKRRGRAAPPGRCHSCARVDTPEWRRGPDGARTLCNACGLHFAKLERKRLQESRSIRPKPEHGN